MPRTVKITAYTYDELSPAAQAKARDWYRRASEGDNYFAEAVIEDAVRMAEIIGIEIHDHPVRLMNNTTRRDPSIWWSLGYTQSDGVWIEATIHPAPYGNVKIREEAPEDTALHQIADRLQAVQGEYGDHLHITVKDSDRGPMDLDVELERADETGLEVTAETYKELREIVRAFSRWIYDGLRREYEYQNSDDAIAENIRANDYTFYQDGARFSRGDE